jgi:cytochrome c-type biogenesis protein CcmE
MDRKRLKFIMLGGGIVVSMAFLLVIGMNRPGGMAYYVTVSEFVERQDKATEDFRLNGKVQDGSILRRPTGQDVEFVMTEGGENLPVAYHGVIPDTFVDGADVVVEGALQDNGTFVAHTLLAKCPSKYEAADEYEGEHPEDVPLQDAATTDSGVDAASGV